MLEKDNRRMTTSVNNNRINRINSNRTNNNNNNRTNTSYRFSKYFLFFRIIGLVMFITSILELSWGVILHQIISAEGIGSWWGALNPLLCSFFAIQVNSTKKLAGMLMNAVLGIFATIIGCIIEFIEYKRLINIQGCYDTYNSQYNYYNTNHTSIQAKINSSCTLAFTYFTQTPVFDCWCVDNVSDKCISFDIGAKVNHVNRSLLLILANLLLSDTQYLVVHFLWHY